MAPRLRHDDYTVGWICALPIELAAAQEMLDEEHEDLEQDEHDTNLYSLGKVGEHNVVIVCLPAGLIGNHPATAVATQLRATFKAVRFGLMVGIGGGVPSAEADIRLGDVVISQPHSGHGGVIQYDFGKATTSGFQRTGFLNSPPTILLGAVSKLRSKQDRRKTRLMEHIAKLQWLPEFTRETAGPDVLFEAEYIHEEGPTCQSCSADRHVNRQPRPNEEPAVHYGTIASGNQVIKHATVRDTVSKEFGGVLCFEMEAAGLMNNFPGLVIRGICDYADSHKNKKWQPYAAGAAAGCAKEILSVIPRAEMATIRTVLQSLTRGDNTAINFLDNGKDRAPENEREACIRTLGFLEIDSREQDISDAVQHTCDWLFDTLEFQKWRNRTDLGTNNGVLCIKGKPGAGKSTLMKHALEHCKNVFPNDLIIAYFFNARGSALEKSPLGMLRSIAYQLIQKDVMLFDQFLIKFRNKQTTSQRHEWQWHQRDLKAFITEVIKRWISKPLLLLVDALDECNGADMQDVVDFLESLSVHANKSGTTLRICLSRRHHPPLIIAKSLELIVENNKDHREDIATYIRAKLAIRDAKIEAEIKKKANGIFMWVVLVVRLLNKASRKISGKKKAMKDALEKIPSELEEVFRILFDKDDEDIAETVLMLQWVLFSEEPLTPEELYAAVEAGDTGVWSQSSDIDHGSIRQSIEHLSKGLIEIRDTDPATVQFIHLSVNDFLLRNKRLQTLDQALDPDPVTASHRRLWAYCWSHIRQVNNTSTNEAYEELNHKYPFLKFAASHIFDHAEKTLDGGAVGEVGVEIEKWLRDGSSWLEWWKYFLNVVTPSDGDFGYLKYNMDAGLLYMLSFRGYASLAKCILAEDGEEGAEVNAQGGQYGNALQAASSRGGQQIVELLLKAGAEANAQGGQYGNALQAASSRGGQQIVELLLKAGAEVNAQGGQYGNAVQAASFRGHQQIVELLLKAGATEVVQDTESEVTNTGGADTEGISVEKSLKRTYSMVSER
ncbi:hypothetical protein P154DRAFT_526419 [Amniculicola lignicola CBS 123094]|uniref:Uncharacterized protein n=1 Tax=Amniculicola lignicola CBS 123094 TaxID=1392246 RepID=A0A6A5W0S1_9PLEO|nr:hypothetical protein P154DRAFT_526419 [Amniculicola lignicola CBS 123094]